MPTVQRALSEGIGKKIEELLKPEKAMQITSPERLRTLLEIFVPEFIHWGLSGSKSVEYLLREMEDGENKIHLIKWKGKDIFLREIRTATIDVRTHIARDDGDLLPTKVFRLREHHLEGDERVRRRHDNSMSEKLNNTEDRYELAVVRAFEQELTFRPADEYLARPHLFRMDEFSGFVYNREQFPKKESTEFFSEFTLLDSDVRETPRYPGLLTYNRIEHFIWIMPSEYYKPEGYHEPGTNHYFEWEQV